MEQCNNASVSDPAQIDVARNGEALTPRARQMLADLEEFLAIPDPLGPEGWETVRKHIQEHGVYMGETGVPVRS